MIADKHVPATPTLDMVIGGERVSAASGETFDVVSPVDGRSSRALQRAAPRTSIAR